MYLPRCRAGITSPVMACAPTMSPPAPMPCRARRGDQLDHVLGQARQDRAHQEDDDRQLEEVLAAVEVAELPPQWGRDGRGQEVGGDHPRQVVEPVQVTGDGGQGRRHDGLVERGQEHPQHQRHQDHEDPAVLGFFEVVVDRARGRGDCGVRSHGRPPCRVPTRPRIDPTAIRTEPGPVRPSLRAFLRARPVGPSTPVPGCAAQPA